MLTRLHYRIHSGLERILPERRLFLKSDTETRFIRLRPVTQLVAMTGAAMFVAWTIVATAVAERIGPEPAPSHDTGSRRSVCGASVPSARGSLMTLGIAPPAPCASPGVRCLPPIATWCR